jgi:drug/metabolite transporter (DMT)-like permease
MGGTEGLGLTMDDQQKMTATDWGLLLALSILWGGSFFFAKVIVQELPPLTVVLIRFAVAALALWLYLRARRLSVPKSLTAWAVFAGMGLLNNLIPAALVTWSQKTIVSGLAAILIATTPLFSILAAHWLTTDEKMTANKIAGILLGIAGVAILVGQGSLSGSEHALIPLFACLAAAISYGFANVFGRRFKRMGIVPVVGAFGQIAATAIMTAPIAIAVDEPWRLMAPDPSVWAAIAGLALLSTALGYVIFFRVLASAGGTNISLVTLLIPVSAILLGRAILGEHLLAAQFAGMALIAIGLVAIDGRVWSAMRILVRASLGRMPSGSPQN